MTAIDSIQAEAYYAHLQGRSLLNSFTPESVRRSVEFFHRAIQADPTYAPGYGSLAEAYQQLSVWTEAPPRAHFRSRWRRPSMRFGSIPTCPMPTHRSVSSMGRTFVTGGRPTGTFDGLSALNPSCSPPRQRDAEFLAEMGRFDEALSIIDAGLVYDPLSRAIQATRAFVLLMARRFDEAIDQAEAVLDTAPRVPDGADPTGYGLRRKRRAPTCRSGLPQSGISSTGTPGMRRFAW